MRILSRILLTLALTSAEASGQRLDTLVNVGGARLAFHIIVGRGVPILFEAGGGDDGTVWNGLLEPLSEITGTTLITYDRAGFGGSALDTTRHGLAVGVEQLERGLHTLGYDKEVILVAHSLGGFYATLYASRHPTHIKGAVLLDGNLSCFATDEYMAKNRDANRAEMAQFEKQGRLGVFYIYADQEATVATMRHTSFPTTVAVTDFVSEVPPFRDPSDAARWKSCHREFAAAAPNRRGVEAYGSGHYIFLDQPALVLDAIVDQYARTLDGAQRSTLLKRRAEYSTREIVKRNAPELRHRISERDINLWGYALLKGGDTLKAIEVFRHNVDAHPGSANTYDSLAETYEAIGDTAAAVKYYRRVLVLNPSSKNAADHLRKLSP
jgi:pimeloyl-ACP methyl ester carboxylesterase